MKIGFIGLGNVGGKLAGSLLRNNFDLTVRDLDETLTNSLKKQILRFLTRLKILIFLMEKLRTWLSKVLIS